MCLVAVLLVLALSAGPALADTRGAAADSRVKIGVLAKRGPERCLAQWAPTADYLTRAIPGKHFEIVPIDFEGIFPKVEKGEVDFIFTNSAMYVELEAKLGVNRIATLKNRQGDRTYTTFGGVIFCRKDRRDIRSLSDIMGRSFMAVEKKSFGGWYMAWREMKKAGIDPFSDFASLTFGGTHDAVVYAVLGKTVDAGTVRTDTLERMQAEGKIKLDDIYVLHELGSKDAHIAFLHSTREYPEWPMARIRHTPDRLAEQVAVRLIEMPEDSEAAKAASCSGWTIPLNYQSVHECLMDLKVAPYEYLGEITLADVISKFWHVLLLTLSLFVVMAFSMAAFIRLNQSIRAASLDLKQEIKEHEQTALLLQAAKAEADTANAAKGSFLANMSHEIRTPMNAIIGMSHLCLGTDLDPRQRDYMEKVHQSARLLLGIINDILDFSKIEAGRLELESIPFRLDDVLGNLSTMISMKAQEKGIEVVFDVNPETPLNLKGDPLRLGQILLNLAGNSVKFTDKGEIVVHIRPTRLDKEKVELEVSVKDTGIGMSLEEQSRLFKSFSQADASTTRRFGGTGLGLAISRHLVREMQGRIWVESDPGRGTCFYFTAVLDRTPEDWERPDTSPMVDLTNLKVLVVDDVASTRQMFATTLASFSFRATCVDSGQAALETLEKAPAHDPFRLVLMDYLMPGMNGMEASRRIKESPLLAGLPCIIMVTALSRDEVMHQARDAGLEGFLTKPVTPSDLLDAIVGTLGGRGGFRKGGASRDQWMIKPLGAISGAHVLVVEDNTINQLVARDLLTQAGLRVTLAANGRQAVDLAAKSDFHAILMDLQMPEMDGFEATSAIRKNINLKRIPIIAMTANAMAGDRERCLAAGMDDHVAKPIEPRLLFETLVKWIPAHEPGRTLPDPGPEKSLDPEADLPRHLAGIDMETGLRRTGGNHRLYLDLLKHFFHDHGNDNQKITKALEDDDIKLAHRTAHTLKGVAGGIGALELQESAQQVETALKAGQTVVPEPMIQALTRDLDIVVRGLKTLATEVSTHDIKPGGNTPMDPETLTALLEECRTMAEEINPDMEDKAQLIYRILQDNGSSHTTLGARLMNQAADLDFDQALETLAQLRDAVMPALLSLPHPGQNLKKQGD
ncbi:MAG: response regulator [Pseudomonadota bacterium]